LVVLFARGVAGVAIYRIEARSISRGQGRSVIAAAAYRHGDTLLDQRQGLIHDYGRKGGIVHSQIIAPEHAPDWARQRQWLWNHLDAAEKRRDAITAREVLVTLPRELGREQQVELVRTFIREQFTARGIIADLAIHAPHALDGMAQPHAHIMLADRPLDPAQPNGLAARKDRTLASPEGIRDLRAAWETHANHALERLGLDLRLDHRSLAVQAAEALERAHDQALPEAEREQALVSAAILDRTPEPKIGPVAMQMHRQGRGENAHALRSALAVRQERSSLVRLAETLRERSAAVLEPARAFWGSLQQAWADREQARADQRDRLAAEQRAVAQARERHARAWRRLPLADKTARLVQWFRQWADEDRSPDLTGTGHRHAQAPRLHQAVAQAYRLARQPGEFDRGLVIGAARELDARLSLEIRAWAKEVADRLGDDRGIWAALQDRAGDPRVKDAYAAFSRAREAGVQDQDLRESIAAVARVGLQIVQERQPEPQKPQLDPRPRGPTLRR
jgi:hypothetical protein